MSETKGPILTRRYLEDIAELADLPLREGAYGILQMRIRMGLAVWDAEDKVYRAVYQCSR